MVSSISITIRKTPSAEALMREANADFLEKGPAITQSNGLLCHVKTCTNGLRVDPSVRARVLRCCNGHQSTVTAAQHKREVRRLALGAAEIEAMRARLAAVPRYPVCDCGGPLMLPEQAGKGGVGATAGRLFCGSCGVTTGKTQRATAEQIDKARAAAKAEGFEVSP